MSVQHNNTELTRVHDASPQKPYTMTLDYGSSLEQLEALIDDSEHCEQEVAYHCKRSRLLNTPGKAKGGDSGAQEPLTPRTSRGGAFAKTGFVVVVVQCPVAKNETRKGLVMTV